MLVANSFDLWQKDAFFSAAEEVQQSADIMESAYRTWLRVRKDGGNSQYLGDLSRELQMALGTAKWQLEEFEKAVRLSYRSRADEITMTRHRQFVSAIEDQISLVEETLRESIEMEGKQPLRWVNLDERERDDLALFLSGKRDTSSNVIAECTKRKESMSGSDQDKTSIAKDINFDMRDGPEMVLPEQSTGLEDVTCTLGADCCIRDDIEFQADQRRMWSLPDNKTLEIVIDSHDGQSKASTSSTEVTPKDKGSRSFFWRPRCEDYLPANGGILSYSQLKLIKWMNQIKKRVHRSPRHQQTLPMVPVSSIRIMLALMLTVFLVVPFLLHST